MDIAQNELDDAKDDDALDRIAPTLKVSIDEGKRPVTDDKVNIRILSDESVGTPDVFFYGITSTTVDGKTTQTIGSPNDGAVSFVSSTEFTATASATNDGLYTIYVEATDASGGNSGAAGDKGDSGDVDVDGETTAILFEHDDNIPDLDVDPSKDGPQDTFSTDDPNVFIRIDFLAEANEYDAQTNGDDLDTHHGVTIVSATLDGADISGDANLLANVDGNVFLYKPATALAIGDHALEVIAQDAAGNKHPVAEKATITITERKPYTLKLNPGWNLVSIPGEPEDSDINAVIPAERIGH